MNTTETTTDTLSPLQAAIIDAGTTEIPFATGGTDYTVQVKDLPDASLLRVLAYGKRMFNDYVNSAKATSDKPAGALAAEWIARAKSGELGQTGTTRATLSPMEKALRDVVVGLYRDTGRTATDARKIVGTNPQDAFRKLLQQKIAASLGVSIGEVDPDLVETAYEKNWPAVEAQARRMVETAQLSVTIDL